MEQSISYFKDDLTVPWNDLTPYLIDVSRLRKGDLTQNRLSVSFRGTNKFMKQWLNGQRVHWAFKFDRLETVLKKAEPIKTKQPLVTSVECIQLVPSVGKHATRGN